MKQNEDSGLRGPGAYIPKEESSTAILEVKKRIPSIRELRDALAQLAGYLTNIRGKQAILLLADPRISTKTILDEYTRLQAAFRPEISERLRILVYREAAFKDKPNDISPQDWKLIEQHVVVDSTKSTVLPRPDLRSEVFRVILHEWFLCHGQLSSKWIENTVGCNYRTVSAAIEWLGPAVKRHSNRRIELKYFPKDAWAQLLAVSDGARATIRYADRSDQPRSPESLARRLSHAGRSDIAIGGVLGAKRYYANLDLTGTARLDLSVHCPGMQCDIDFVRRLDPALERIHDRNAPARLVLHFVRRRKSLFDRDDRGILWADPVECLLDLQEARLESQAFAFAEFLSSRGRSFSG